MIGLEQTLEIRSRDTVVTVQFYAIDRRFGHEIHFEHQGAQLTLKTDDELTSDWPPSPPIQDVHYERRENCELLFGVGMSGKTHYSVSIAANPTRQIQFEFAANIKSVPLFLGTTYHIGMNDAAKDDNQLESFEEFSSVVSTDPNSESTIRQTDKQITFGVTPKATEYGSLPQTIQWGFEIQLDSHA